MSCFRESKRNGIVYSNGMNLYQIEMVRLEKTLRKKEVAMKVMMRPPVDLKGW